MNFKKILTLLFFLFLGTVPAFADGGIPIWLMTAQDVMDINIYVIIGALTETQPEIVIYFLSILFYLLISGIFLTIVVFIETVVFRIVLGKINSWKKILKTVFKSNIVSTFLGAVIFAIVILVSSNSEQELLHNVYSAHDAKMATAFLGVHGSILFGIGFLIHNLYYFVISYYSEYIVSLDQLKELYTIDKIKKAVLWSNITTYALPILYSVICTIVMLFNNAFDDLKIKEFISYYPKTFITYFAGTIILPIILTILLVIYIESKLKKYENT